jgi:hypothetical protein
MKRASYVFLMIIVLILMFNACSGSRTERDNDEQVSATDIAAENTSAGTSDTSPVETTGVEYDVHNAGELIDTIGSDRVIRLYPGNYDLYDAFTAEELERGSDNSKFSESDYQINFNRSVITFKNLENVQLIGMADSDGQQIDFITDNLDGCVLSLENCENISLANFNIGHNPRSTGCSGDVLRLTSVSNVKIDNCRLFGCGFNGLVIKNSDNLKINNSAVVDCSYSILDMEKLNTCRFHNTEFTAAGGFRLFACQGVVFEECYFSEEPDRKITLDSAESLIKYIQTREPLWDSGRTEQAIDIEAIESILPIEDNSLETLLEYYGDNYIVRQETDYTKYIYESGQVLAEHEKGRVSSIKIGDNHYMPWDYKRAAGSFTAANTDETAYLCEIGLWNRLLFIVDNVTGEIILSEKLPGYYEIHDFTTADITGDGKKEIYVSGTRGTKFGLLYGIEKGEFVRIYDYILNAGFINNISYQLSGNIG